MGRVLVRPASGGLLVSCAPATREAVLEIFRQHGFAQATEIGRLDTGSQVSIGA